MNRFEPVSIGVLGMGGYGASVIHSLRHDQASPRPHVRLHAVCSNDFDRHPEAVAHLRAAGVRLLENVDQFLAEPTEAVWLPLPIPLHRPMTERALAAGKAVMCEKPAAGCIDDVDAMIAARDRARLPVAIGFQDIYDPTTPPLKRALLDGRIGQVRSATLRGCWPRGSHYYGRAGWAGSFKRDGVWVMDSPAHNAMAHYVNIVLFLLGPAPAASAEPVEVEAELYRVNPIENYDTISMRLTLDNGVKFLVLLTHACEHQTGPDIVIHGDRGTVTRTAGHIHIDAAGQVEEIARPADLRPAVVRRLALLTRGIDDPQTAVATLEVARAQVLAVNGASEAAAITPLDPSLYKTVELSHGSGGQVRVIPGIEQAFAACAAQQRMLHESGLAAWSVPAGRKNLRGYKRFSGPRDLASGQPVVK